MTKQEQFQTAIANFEAKKPPGWEAKVARLREAMSQEATHDPAPPSLANPALQNPELEQLGKESQQDRIARSEHRDELHGQRDLATADNERAFREAGGHRPQMGPEPTKPPFVYGDKVAAELANMGDEDAKRYLAGEAEGRASIAVPAGVAASLLVPGSSLPMMMLGGGVGGAASGATREALDPESTLGSVGTSALMESVPAALTAGLLGAPGAISRNLRQHPEFGPAIAGLEQGGGKLTLGGPKKPPGTEKFSPGEAGSREASYETAKPIRQHVVDRETADMAVQNTAKEMYFATPKANQPTSTEGLVATIGDEIAANMKGRAVNDPALDKMLKEYRDLVQSSEGFTPASAEGQDVIAKLIKFADDKAKIGDTPGSLNKNVVDAFTRIRGAAAKLRDSDAQAIADVTEKAMSETGNMRNTFGMKPRSHEMPASQELMDNDTLLSIRDALGKIGTREGATANDDVLAMIRRENPELAKEIDRAVAMHHADRLRKGVPNPNVSAGAGGPRVSGSFGRAAQLRVDPIMKGIGDRIDPAVAQLATVIGPEFAKLLAEYTQTGGQ